MKNNYKYSEPEARFYDVIYDKILNKAGYDYYQQEIANTKGKVLEVGAGTGRILVPALQNGADIYGIDQSEIMLEKLREKLNPENYFRVSLQDVREFTLKERFNLIISPFRVFGHLFTPEDQLKAIDNIYNHLETGGRFIFDLFIPNHKMISEDVKDVSDFEGEYEPGKKLQRLSDRIYDNINQIINVTFKYVWDENGNQMKAESLLPLRYYFRYELENLIARSGFKLEKIYGNFDRSELSNSSKEFVIICLKL